MYIHFRYYSHILKDVCLNSLKLPLSPAEKAINLLPANPETTP